MSASSRRFIPAVPPFKKKNAPEVYSEGNFYLYDYITMNCHYHQNRFRTRSTDIDH
jgi:hypothetical protein